MYSILKGLGFSAGIAGLLLLLCGCEWIAFNPNEVILAAHERNVTQKNIRKLTDAARNDTLTLAVFGDSQRSYDDTYDLVQSVNRIPGIDMAIHTGDLTDFGLCNEFRWKNGILEQLNMPHFTVIGNHDLVAHGGMVYREMYGAYNYAFVHAGLKFVFVNTNSVEYGHDGSVPDIAWLDSELADTGHYNRAILVSHVPVWSPDFDRRLAASYMSILQKYNRVLVTLNGHNHNFYAGMLPGSDIPYINTFSVNKRQYVVLRVTGTDFRYDIIRF